MASATTGITQMRFYSDDSPNNSPAGWKSLNYCDTASFTSFAPIQQVGIQTLPGTRVYFNGSTTPVIIGASGIYELDLRNTTAILSSLRFAASSMKIINDNPEGYLIIDLITNPLKTKNEDYFLIKECLFEQNMLENNYIEVNILKEFINVSKKNNAYNTSRYSLKKLKSMNDIYYQQNKELKSEFNHLKKDSEHYSNINKAVLSSNSWKFTKPLRLIKKLISR